MRVDGFLRRAINAVRFSHPWRRLSFHGYRLGLAWPKRIECNLCGWTGRHFITRGFQREVCPACGARVRHRLIMAALQFAPHIAEATIVDGARVLHLSRDAVEIALRPRARLYVTADYSTAWAQVRTDMACLAFVDGAFDVLIASGVLEHIPDDRQALAEVHRVLRPGGTAILSVPVMRELAVTSEDPSIATPEARADAYGQSDHLRNYGTDFSARVESAGFAVSYVDNRAFSLELVRRHVLVAPAQAGRSWDSIVVFARALAAADEHHHRGG